jgi:hypothetical protein
MIKRIAFSLLPSLVLIAAVELTLRLTGAYDSCDSPVNRSRLLICDPILMFRVKPDFMFFPDTAVLNDSGFRSPHRFGPKPPGTYRIITLGDSCTFGSIGAGFVSEPYPQRLEQLFVSRRNERFEVLNAGVPGYNSWHGIMLLRTKLRDLEPDIITVRYGWNDHWPLREGQGPDTFRELDEPWRLVQDVLLRTAIYPYSQRLGLSMWSFVGPRRDNSMNAAQWAPAISLKEYEHNLKRIVELAHRQGATVWLQTVPHAFLLPGYRPDPAAIAVLWANQLDSFETLVALHEPYNEVVRKVGTELGVGVIDLEVTFHAHASERLYEGYDPVHSTQIGHFLEAETLYRAFMGDKALG